LPKAEGEGHLLFANGLVEETDVSVHLRKGIASRLGRPRTGKFGHVPSHRQLARVRPFLEIRARPPPSTNLDVVKARAWYLGLLSVSTIDGLFRRKNMCPPVWVSEDSRDGLESSVASSTGLISDEDGEGLCSFTVFGSFWPANDRRRRMYLCRVGCIWL
jgi:hypothetical protein